MLPPLTAAQADWVDRTLEAMTIDQCIGQLLCPEDRKYTPDDVRAIVRDVPIGSFFFGVKAGEVFAECLDAIQSQAEVPVLIAADMESGVGGSFGEDTRFPDSVSFAAAGAVDASGTMGRAVGAEARARGVHWTFAPVVDLHANPRNACTVTRAFSNDPDVVIAHACPRIAGIQHDGQMAATAKHFPGDGLDDRDQHFCTNINPLPMDRWHATYGRVWRAVIEAGVMSIMSGHVALPHYEGLADAPAEAMPATLSGALQVDLLRRELGFEGVIVSDACPMLGMTTRIGSDELAVANIAAGSDVLLFADPRKDFERLSRAVRGGRLDAAQVRRSARRVLEMKARLGLGESLTRPAPTDEQRQAFAAVAADVAERSMTLARSDANLPAPLPDGARVLVVVSTYARPGKDDDKPHLPVVIDELKGRGHRVDYLLNPDHKELIETASSYDRVFVNFIIGMHRRPGTIGIHGEMLEGFWRAFWVDAGNAVFTSFGSPHILYELPHIPNLLLAYSGIPDVQRAAVRAWLGEIECVGRCPMPRRDVAAIVRHGSFLPDLSGPVEAGSGDRPPGA
jgi:beta-N-acetylhexosaminidase